MFLWQIILHLKCTKYRHSFRLIGSIRSCSVRAKENVTNCQTDQKNYQTSSFDSSKKADLISSKVRSEARSKEADLTVDSDRETSDIETWLLKDILRF